PGRVLYRNLEQREQGRERRLERAVEREDPADHLLPDSPRVVARTDLEVGLEQIDDGQVRGGLAVGDTAALEKAPALHAMRVHELPVEARLADAGLAQHRDHLPVSALGLLEGPAQLIELAVAADEAREPARGRRVQARSHRARPDDLVDLDPLRAAAPPRRRARPPPGRVRAHAS